MSIFEITGVDPDRLARIRETGRDEFGNPVAGMSAEGGEQLRCCLRRAQRTETIAVMCFTPWTEPSPWLEAGPIFVHVDQCEGYGTPGDYPVAFADSPSMFNTFYADGSRDYEHIRFVQPEDDHTAVLNEVLDHPEVDHLHVRSSVAGCFTFAVHRAK